jgi:F0F1-type ATP synthase membrane subunit b/b'
MSRTTRYNPAADVAEMTRIEAGLKQLRTKRGDLREAIEALIRQHADTPKEAELMCRDAHALSELVYDERIDTCERDINRLKSAIHDAEDNEALADRRASMARAQ